MNALHDQRPAPTPGMAQRLRAHARLCREIAAESVTAEVTHTAGVLADACDRAAGAMERAQPDFRHRHTL